MSFSCMRIRGLRQLGNGLLDDVFCNYSFFLSFFLSSFLPFFLSFFLSFLLSFFLSFFLLFIYLYIYLLRHIVDSIKVALGVGNWQLGIEYSGIRNNAMICLSDQKCPKHPWISYTFVAHLCSQCRFSLCSLGISASSLWTRAPTKR